MNLALIVVTIIVLIINILYFFVSRIEIRSEDLSREDVSPDLQRLLDEMDEKIKKLEEKEIQAEYDQLKLKVGTLVHKGKNVIVEFTFRDKPVPLVLKCYPKALGIWNPETNSEQQFKHMDDFFTADTESGINFRRDWGKIKKIKVRTLRNF